jgi:hypothetical protein
VLELGLTSLLSTCDFLSIIFNNARVWRNMQTISFMFVPIPLYYFNFDVGKLVFCDVKSFWMNMQPIFHVSRAKIIKYHTYGQILIP